MTPIEAPSSAPGIPCPRPRGLAAATFLILFAGLGLIFLGGCFLMGVMMMVMGDRFVPEWQATPMRWTDEVTALMWVLYIAAFGCFSGAMWLIVAGARGLLGALKG